MSKKSKDLASVHLNVETLDCLETVVKCLPQVRDFEDLLVSFLLHELLLNRLEVQGVHILCLKELIDLDSIDRILFIVNLMLSWAILHVVIRAKPESGCQAIVPRLSETIRTWEYII